MANLSNVTGPISYGWSPAPVATEFSVSVTRLTGVLDGSAFVGAAPRNGAWPAGTLLTPSSTYPGMFTPPTITPTGLKDAIFQFTPNAPGSGTLSITASGSGITPVPTPTPTPVPTPTPTPVPTPTPTPTPATQGNGSVTLTGIPSTIVAGQFLSGVTYSVPAGGYFVLYRVAGAVEEGARWISTTLPGNLTVLVPQTASAYTVRVYDALIGGNLLFETSQINVTAAPGPLPAQVTQTADTGTTQSSVTMNWTATGTSYRFLARPGVGSFYGSLVDTTVSTNNYTLAGLAANSSPRAIVIPQNANGFGPPSGPLITFFPT